MKRRVCSMVLIAALALPLSGCPIPAIDLGIWLLDIDGKIIAVWIVEGGATIEINPVPPEADNVFNGTVTWEQVGRTVTFTQVTSGSMAEYTGRLQNRSTIVDGTWMQTAGGSASGTWTGMQL